MVEKILFSRYLICPFFYLEDGVKVTPSLPQRGRQPKGSIPLPPLIVFQRIPR
jgi:hypothetical protein